MRVPSSQLAAGAAILVALLVPLAFFPQYPLYVTDLVIIAAIAAIGLNVVTGYAGQASIGTAAFLAIGAFTAAGVASRGGFLLALLAGSIAAAIAGGCLGIPSLRVRGLYLIVTTLVFQYVVQYGFEALQVHYSVLAGYTVPAASIGPVVLSSSKAWYAFLAIVLLATSMSVRSLVSGRPGRGWTAVRESEIAASVAGVSITRYKMSAFVTSAALTGLAGALLAYFTGLVSYDQFSLTLAVSYVAMIIIGGTGSIAGSIVGAVIITALPFLLSTIGAQVLAATSLGPFLSSNLTFVELALEAVLLTAFLIFEPRGVSHLVRRLVASIRGLKPRAAVEVPGRERESGAGMAAPVELGIAGAVAGRDALVGQAGRCLLSVRDLRVMYGRGKVAVDGVSFDLQSGAVLAITGPNGAGKTSLLRAIAGLVPASLGSVRVEGKPMDGVSVFKRARSGILLVSERSKVFPTLTVAEHMRLANARVSATRTDAARASAAVLETFPALGRHINSKAGSMSGGERQMLALAAALVQRPKVLLIDEMSLGLAVGVYKSLARSIASIAATGVGIVMVEEAAALVRDTASLMIYLDAGRTTWTGRPEEHVPGAGA